MNRLGKISIRGLFLLVSLTAFFALYLAGCRRTPEAPKITWIDPAQATAEFVGSDACTPCHKDVAKEHHDTFHAKTFHAVTKEDMKGLLPPIAPITKSDYEVTEKEGKYFLTLTNAIDAHLELTYGLGSGKNGITFINPVENNEIVESRLSYFPTKGRWYITPGHNEKQGAELGYILEKPIARRCVQCHAVTLPENQTAPDPKFYGVGCESCHGAGSKHIEAMRQSKTAPIGMVKLAQLKGEDINNLCGKCHRTERDVRKGTPEEESTQRFQPYGLSKSKCFQKSDGSLTCLTCHDPHANVEKRSTYYEAICKSCHNAAPEGAQNKGRTSKICRVNPQNDCIRCHMPNKPLFNSDKGIRMEMADHFIHVQEAQR